MIDVGHLHSEEMMMQNNQVSTRLRYQGDRRIHGESKMKSRMMNKKEYVVAVSKVDEQLDQGSELRLLAG
jgi:hypothetical protein